MPSRSTINFTGPNDSSSAICASSSATTLCNTNPPVDSFAIVITRSSGGLFIDASTRHKLVSCCSIGLCGGTVQAMTASIAFAAQKN